MLHSAGFHIDTFEAFNYFKTTINYEAKEKRIY